MNTQTIVNVNVPLFNGLAAMSRAYGEEVIRACAIKYGFDPEEAITLFIKPRQFEKSIREPKEKSVAKSKSPSKPKEKVEVAEVPLPWTGKAREDLCCGIRLNHGLHTQCSMLPTNGGEYCKTCQKQADGNATGKPTYGTVGDRVAVPMMEYRDPKGKQSVPYAVVMAKLGITREKAVEEARKIGVELPDEVFEERIVKRGRPKKDATASDTESDASQTSQDSVKKGRGRPKKEKKVIESNSADDLISALVAQANLTIETQVAETVDKANMSPKAAEKLKNVAKKEKKEKKVKKEAVQKVTEVEVVQVQNVAEVEVAEVEVAEVQKVAQVADEENSHTPQNDDDDDDETLEVEEFTFEGKKYFKDPKNNHLYDPETNEEVGIWNAITKKIDEVYYYHESDDESDDDDDE